ncbi:hypothetical protein EHV10_01405 [Lachnoanaerobaculum gingivalis]|uniref:CRISPR-associated protein Csm4 n=1 Tax=Lachnoanaerobaculum gingivalis TaxID=2490855 RepID=A0A3P3R004_9FIRM|nr:hypothetical protein [Lachnoanaerobaculum gingivalis]RRJ26715.1 hypothetical protein EHV10_01405 [Lachnoanaerobaculum gingivalis]
MIRYEVKLNKIGEMTTLPDSQRLFGFLINNSKKYCCEEDISSFVRGVRQQEQKCMISNLLPSGYYPIPKEFIMQKMQGRLNKNQEEIKKLEEMQMKLRGESEEVVQKLREKNKAKKLNKVHKDELYKEIQSCKSQLEKIKADFSSNSKLINSLSSKNIYETVKRMDFIEQNQLKALLKLGESKDKIRVDDLLKFNYIKKNRTFIQKFRLENQIKQLPGIPNVAYSLPILSFENQKGDIQRQFSFFVEVREGTCISSALEAMNERLDSAKKGKDIFEYGIPCFLGGKASSGYNEYRIYSIEKSKEAEGLRQVFADDRYLNIGMLLPNFDKIDAQMSVLDIYTSDRKPFEIEYEIPKVISFITTGSVIKLKQDKTDLYEVGKSIDNSRYNPMYKKNAIIFGNSYLVKLEVN